MSCCCDSQHPLLGALMGALAVPAGSIFRVGMHLSASDLFEAGEQAVTNQIWACLMQTGNFSEINVSASGVINRYYLIRGRTAEQSASIEALKGMIVGTIQDCAADVESVDNVDPLIIESIPQQSANQPNVQQPNWQNYTGQAQSQSSQCEWSKMSLGDYMACQLGIKGTVGGMAAGAVGSLVAVGAITLIAVTLLKR